MQVLAYFSQRASAALDACQCAVHLQAGQQPEPGAGGGGGGHGTADCSCDQLEHFMSLLHDLAYTDAEQLYQVGPGGGSALAEGTCWAGGGGPV